MSTNYRSGQKIIDIAGELIQKNTNRFPKSFLSARGQAGYQGSYVYRDFNNRAEEMEYVVRQIKELHLNGVDYQDIAVLFRTNNLAQAPMEALMNQNIPVKTDEMAYSIYDRWIFKLLCSYLRLAGGHWKQSYINDILTKPNRYLKLAEFKDCPYEQEAMLKRLDYMRNNPKTKPWLISKAETEIHKMFAAFPPGRFKADTSPMEALKSLSQVGIETAIKERAIKRHESEEDAKMELTSLTFDAARFRSINEWFRYAKEDKQKIKRLNQNRSDTEGVNVMTIHTSKGCEWKYVFIIDVTQNLIPHRNSLVSDEQIEEERRLLYVAMTRAKDGLYVLNSGIKSIFMEEMMEEKQQIRIAASRIPLPNKGDIFVHVKYGIGVFHGWERSSTMKIAFPQGVKKFNFPDAIEDGYLKPM